MLQYMHPATQTQTALHANSATQCTGCVAARAKLSINNPALTAYPRPRHLGQGRAED